MASTSNYHAFFFLYSILLFISAFAATAVSLGSKSLVLPVLKDKCSGQYLTQINQRTPLVPVKLTIDLGARFMWIDCDTYVSSSYKPVPCDSALCALADAHSCTTECYSSPKPGCHNNTCSHFPGNPVIGLSTSGDIGQDIVSLKSINGVTVSVPDVPFVCGTGILLENLADGVTGVAGLGRHNISLPSALGFPNKFSVCLSSTTNSSGIIILGDSVKIPSNLLTHTPLIRNPVSTAGSHFEGEASTDYFIGLTSIKIAGKEVKFNKTLLSIDSEGKGGTKISTVEPYTVLHTTIYKAVVRAFVKQLNNRFFQVQPPVAPFGACFQYSTTFDVDEQGPMVPLIDLILDSAGGSSVVWRLVGANSMVRISSLVMCLGVVDGGLEPRTSIVIGGHQLEDNLLQFDLANSRLGFSSSLLAKNTTCSKFKFSRSKLFDL
ncbi:probable aspartic proteinase GIP2 [Mercurialis annua]|uniref:probable aspartic proteinase GIP2 n=1 Tax=Mercurialis annua TaxID=3986 RepID=UPI00215F11F2|nr:probable aspartic proteinase GIP2 [Mercurialis annua]